MVGFPVGAGEFIVLQSTTTTQNSGLLEVILPEFEAASGIEVRVVAVGTGQAIRNAMNGDGDVLLVHAWEAEEAFVAGGWGVERFDLMYNDFVVVGPVGDPAGVAGMLDVVAALGVISEAGIFMSRGDGSGTHLAEMRLWDLVGEDVAAASGGWYRETGAGMGTTLNIAVEIGAYVLTDRGTWISFGNKRGFAVLVEGDARLLNQYGVTLVDPARHGAVKAVAGQALVDWLTGAAGQAAIAGYRLGGEQLFFPNAARD
ncbi:MAG: substrate-binding domain-containing protein [Paracoccaceae bacterium]